jgi:long-chain fatty acid transport protein
MWVWCVRGALVVGSAAGVVLGATVAAQAGGFAIREQSTAGQGASFAGVAAGGSLSSMFWNPAIITQYYGKTIQADAAGIFPNAQHSYSASTLATLLGGINPSYLNGVSDSGDDALVPSTYASWQINDKVWLGISVNAPFGLSVSFPTAWAGAAYAQNSEVKSYNFAPTIAYKINDMLSVALGVQMQYMKVSYDQLAAPVPTTIANLEGSGWAFGFTAGATFTPMPGTVIGIGYRSALDQDIDGTLSATTGGSTPGSISTEIRLPDMVTIGLRQRIGDRFTLLAGFEWSNWSRIGTTTVRTPSGATATISGGQVVLPFQYDDGYLYSLGGEYQYSPALTLRAGIAFEKSPITDNVRTPRLPDNDRTWYSVGASYKVEQVRGLTLDAGYSYIDVKDTPINLGPTTGNPWSGPGSTVYAGSVDSHVHLLSVGLRYQWDVPERATTMLITK